MITCIKELSYCYVQIPFSNGCYWQVIYLLVIKRSMMLIMDQLYHVFTKCIWVDIWTLFGKQVWIYVWSKSVEVRVYLCFISGVNSSYLGKHNTIPPICKVVLQCSRKHASTLKYGLDILNNLTKSRKYRIYLLLIDC